VPHAFFSHTGDVGVSVWANSIDGVFAAAVTALVDAVTDSTAVQARETVTLSCRAPQLDLLLHAFLSDILFHLDARRLLPCDAVVSITRDGGQWLLQARVAGERVDPDRHAIKLAIKAVTYHLLHVDQVDGVWQATLVFDI
jgi:SHS2 domain-containing protein